MRGPAGCSSIPALLSIFDLPLSFHIFTPSLTFITFCCLPLNPDSPSPAASPSSCSYVRDCAYTPTPIVLRWGISTHSIYRQYTEAVFQLCAGQLLCMGHLNGRWLEIQYDQKAEPHKKQTAHFLPSATNTETAQCTNRYNMNKQIKNTHKNKCRDDNIYLVRQWEHH